MAKPIKEDDLWYIDDSSEENDLWAQEEIDNLTRSMHHYKPRELEEDHPGCELDKRKRKEFNEDKEED